MMKSCLGYSLLERSYSSKSGFLAIVSGLRFEGDSNSSSDESDSLPLRVCLARMVLVRRVVLSVFLSVE